MKLISLLSMLAGVLLVMGASLAMAEDHSAILRSLNSDGVSVQHMSDAQLDEVKGTGFVGYQPWPGYRQGVRYIQMQRGSFGSYYDYKTWWVNMIFEEPTGYRTFTENGNKYRLHGDIYYPITNTPGQEYAHFERHLIAVQLLQTPAGDPVWEGIPGKVYTSSKKWNRPLGYQYRW